MKKLAREIVDAYKFLFRTPPKNKEIVFYAEHKGDWPFFEGIVGELTSGRAYSISYITSDSSDPILSLLDPHISVFYSRILAPYLLAFLNAKVCVMTMPDLEHLAIRR